MTEALQVPGVDAVTIATPPHTHGPLVLEAVAAGKHVLCEKPFARDADEARRLLDAAEHAGVIHLLGTEFRWAPGQALAARLIAAGAIGAPRLAMLVLHIPLLADPAAELPAWWSDADEGGGWLGAHAAHAVDQVRVTLGEFAGVSAGLPRVVERQGSAEDSYLVHFKVQSGAEGILQSTAGDWGPLLLVTRFVGSEGTLWTEGDAVFIADRTGTRQEPIPDDLRVGGPEAPPADLLVTAYDLLHSTGIDLGPYTRLAEVFRDLIRGEPIADDPRPATFVDGVADMAVLDAIRRSARERSWVALGQP
jgi:predicted dehydrogenase